MTQPNTETKRRALRLRKRLKQRKPNFVRPESWRYVRIKESWRRPKGLDHKVRLKYDGWPPGVEAGYRGPREARGLHPSGYQEVLVCNTEDLQKVNSETQVARIAHTVGKRKRASILTEAKRKKITILNIKQTKAKEPEEEETTEEKTEGKEGEIEEAEELEKGSGAPSKNNKEKKKQ